VKVDRMDEPVTPPESAHSTTVATYAVLSGLTMLIPVPFVDDAVRTRVQRRMVRALSERRGLQLDDATVRTLGDDPSSGVASKVAGAVVTYPLKKIFRKTFVVLAGKEAVDTVSQTYHLGYLVDWAFIQRWHEAATAERIRAGITEACKSVGTSPVDKAIRAAWDASKGRLGALGGRGIRVDDRTDAGAADASPEVRGVADALLAAVGRVPDEHFALLRARLAAALGLAARDRG
jgi:uncharacterized protein (DUF697 family)